MSKIAMFLDIDGMLIFDVPYNTDPDRIILSGKSGNALSRLYAIGCELVAVTNQTNTDGDDLTLPVLKDMEARLRTLVRDKAGAELSGFYYCPWEKPQPGLILQAAFDLELDLRRSWMVGDTLDSIESGRRAGCHTILINNGNETEWKLSPQRQPHFIVSNLEEAARTILSILKYTHEDLFAVDVDAFSLMVE